MRRGDAYRGATSQPGLASGYTPATARHRVTSYLPLPLLPAHIRHTAERHAPTAARVILRALPSPGLALQARLALARIQADALDRAIEEDRLGSITGEELFWLRLQSPAFGNREILELFRDAAASLLAAAETPYPDCLRKLAQADRCLRQLAPLTAQGAARKFRQPLRSLRRCIMRQKQRRSGAETLHVIDRHTPAVAPTAWEDLLGRLRSITWRRIGVAVETALCVVACRRPEPKSDHPLRIDLSGCNFSKLRLPGANLAGVRLAHVNLDGADLSFADLRGADLTCASLRHARLAGADLRQAVLDEADFTGADLTLTAMDPYPIPKTATPDAHSNHTLHSTGAGQQPREPKPPIFPVSGK